MKILLLTKEYPPYVYGGAGVHIEYLSRELMRHAEVEVRCFGDQDVKLAGLRVRGYETDSSRFRCPPPLIPVFEAAQRCLDMNSSGMDAELVHCHTWYAHLAGIMAKRCYGIPLVITTHSLEPQRPWKASQLGSGYRFSAWVERAALELADAVVAVSQPMRNDIVRLFEVDERRVQVIHNGIDPDEYSPRSPGTALQRYGIDPRRPYLLFVGRMTEQKGIRYLLRAVEFMDPGFSIVLCAGAADTPEYGREIRELAAQAASRRKGIVWIEEMVPKDSLIELYSRAAVFCCPSIYEPFGIINLEAMASETAVVAARVGGIPEIVVDGETGYLVPLEDIQEPLGTPADADKYAKALAAPINRLMADPALRARFGRAGRKRVLERFSWAKIADATAALYREVLRSQ